MSSSATTFWKLAGMTFLQYSQTSAAVVRLCLKEPLRTKALAREKIFFKKLLWKPSYAGVPVGPLKKPIESL